MASAVKNGNGARPAAVIDIGSNTTRLLVAERRGDGIRQLLSQKAYTRLGRGQNEDGSIPEAKIEELARTISTQVKLAKVLGAKHAFAMATAATRDAANADEILDIVKGETGVKIDVLDQDEEARLAFLGATHLLPQDPEESIAVVDAGGGSTEVAVGTLKDGVKWSTSFRIGSATLSDRHITHDPPSAADLDETRAAVTQMFDEFPFPNVDQAIAIGGTASSLRRLVGNVLEHESMERAIRLVTSNSAEVVSEEFGVDFERVQVLPAGVMILEDIGDRLQRPLKIGKGGLREGKLLELLS
jgi:exopolyphosphatase/guanosine-5'-triphosphate,3'-diphosphate pyrophosphatase